MMEVDGQPPPPPAVEEPPPPQVQEEEEEEEEEEPEQEAEAEEDKPAPSSSAAAAAAPHAHSHRRTPRRATEGIKPWMVQDDVEEELEDPNAGKRPCRLCRVSKVRCDRGAPCSRCVRLGLDCQEQEKQRRGGGQAARANGHGHGRKGSSSGGGGSSGNGAGSHHGGGRRRRAHSVSSLTVGGLGLHEDGETGSLDDELGANAPGGSGRGRAAKAPRRQQGQGQGRPQLPHETIAGLLGMASAATANGMLVPSARHHAGTGPRSVASGHTTGSETSSMSGGGLALGGGGGGGYLMCLTVSPTQVLLDTFTKLHAQGRVCRGKTLTVMRSWALAYLRERHEGVSHRLHSLARALGFDWRALLSDPDLVQECFAQTRGALAAGARPGQPAAAAPQAAALAAFAPQQLPPFVKDLYTDAAAGVALVSAQGALRVLGTPLFARDYMNPEKCNAALARDRTDPFDILGSLIAREDQPEFFESLAAMLFSNPKPYAEVAHVVKSITRRQTLLSLARARFLVADGGEYWVLVLSFQRLPSSVYLNPGALRTPTPYFSNPANAHGHSHQHMVAEDREGENDSTATGTSAEDDDSTAAHAHAHARGGKHGHGQGLHPLLLARTAGGSYAGGGQGGSSGLSSGMESPDSAHSPTAAAHAANHHGATAAAFSFFGGGGKGGGDGGEEATEEEGMSRSTSCEDVTTATGGSGSSSSGGRSSAAGSAQQPPHLHQAVGAGSSGGGGGGGGRFTHSTSTGDLILACAKAIANAGGEEAVRRAWPDLGGAAAAAAVDNGGGGSCYVHGLGQPPTQQQQQAAADREVLMDFLDDLI